ncbi:Ig-like domain-containing protein, partial [Neptunicoccus sediminis]|uniref:Ig-like domain-containing protein n=1 Tax=Neptunicoccus sediminis TaxID=1892596 RepID=UPI00084604A7
MTATDNDDLIDERTALGSVLVDGLGGDDTILGSDFDDSLSGSGGYDTIFGGDGKDEISGGDLRDNLYGGAGKDLLSGDDGNDRVYGRRGDDTIFGGEGKDILRGHAGDDVIHGGQGADTLKGHGGDDILEGDDGEDYLLGGDGDDVLRGGLGDDDLHGGHGDDKLSGGDGNDVIHGGTGMDRIYGGTGDDDIYGGFGKDRIQGGDGDDTIAGGAGGDEILGGAGADSIRGGRGHDTIKGGANDDIIAGGSGDDTLFGGSGDDVAVYGGSLYDYSWSTSGKTVTVVDNSTRNGDSGTDVLQKFEVLRFNDGDIHLGKTNNAPFVTGNNAIVRASDTVDFTVTGIDFDMDAVALFDVSYSGPGDYSVTGSTFATNSNHTEFTANVTFLTNGAFEGLAFGEAAIQQIVFTFFDSNGGYTSHTVNVTVYGEHNAPVAQAGTASGDEDTVISGSVAASDVDGDTLTFALATDGTNGAVTMAADGSYSYTPDGDF